MTVLPSLRVKYNGAWLSIGRPSLLVRVTENVKPTFTVHINTALAHDLVVTLSNNATVTIKAGETSAPYTHDAQGDDVYKDAGEISLGIKSAVDVDGRAFENLQLGDAASVKVT
ncbi:immunoglobulin-like domain-containing protein, partial [Pseudomonas sp. DCB_AW]|uniref:immunoglobulin-like domain-containing protein n=1 Tax=Pseudomonas sp. DCB_AW TaxID=2993596 RepID=UPI002B0593CE